MHDVSREKIVSAHEDYRKIVIEMSIGILILRVRFTFYLCAFLSHFSTSFEREELSG